MKPIDLNILLRNVAYATALIFGGIYWWSLHDLRTLTNTNDSLAAYVTETLPSLETATAALRASHEEALEVLRARGPRAYEATLVGLVK